MENPSKKQNSQLGEILRARPTTRIIRYFGRRLKMGKTQLEMAISLLQASYLLNVQKNSYFWV